MPASTSDRALRRLVVQLAKASPADIDAVLDKLDPGQRREAQALLDAYLHPGTPSLGALPAPVDRIEGLSPWLADRLEGKWPGAAAQATLDITPSASAALRECALALIHAGRLTLQTPPPAPRPSLLQRLRAALVDATAAV